jgi:hypothetical protein
MSTTNLTIKSMHIIKRAISLALLFILAVTESLGQSTFTVSFPVAGAITTPLSLNLPALPVVPKYFVKSAKFKLSLGYSPQFSDGTFTYGSTNFTATYKVNLTARDAANNLVNNVFVNPAVTFNVDNTKPEQTFYKEFSSFMQNPASAIRKFQFTAPSVPVVNPSSFLPAIGCTAFAEVEYGIDVRDAITGNLLNVQYPGIAGTVISNTRTIEFAWNTLNSSQTVIFPNYEFQLLKLENTDMTNVTNNNQKINTVIDWNKALTIETQSRTNNVSVTMSEGTGYYIWRVRPIGSYYPGGIANPNNHGKWSNDVAGIFPQGGTVSFNSFTPALGLIFYQEVDDNINWIFQRVFTEEGKSKESISYANGLNQVKQTQTSTKKGEFTMVTQIITDFSGRPSLVALPQPVTNQGYSALDGFKPDYLKESVTGKPYVPANFDESLTGKDKNPDKVVTGVYDGTSLFNTIHQAVVANALVTPQMDRANYVVPDAEGYSYTRTLYYNDGTGRVKEQSMAGNAHAIGTAAGQGHTKKILYSTPTEEELIKVFGDEAPKNTKVLKTTTIDENGTASISYSSGGKVIATCIADVITTPRPDANLAAITSPAVNIPNVQDFIENSSFNGNSYTSIKRLAFSEQTALNVSYNYNCNALGGCASGTCGYKLKITVKSLDGGPNYELFANINCASNPVGPITNFVDGLGNPVTIPLTLPAGSYVVEKSLTPDPTTTNVNATPSTGLIAVQNLLNYMLSQVTNVVSYNAFVNALSSQANFNAYLAGNSTAAAFGVTTVPVAISAGGDMTIDPTLTNCCGGIGANIGSNFSFTCLDFSTMTQTQIDAQFAFLGGGKYDFMGYLGSVALELGTTINFNTSFPGWSNAQQVNDMMKHMLTDKYYSGKRDQNNHNLKEDLTPITSADIKVQYRCEDVWGCWMNIVNSYRDLVSNLMQTNNVKNETGSNTDDGSSTNSDYDGTFDNNSGGGFVSALAQATSAFAKSKDQETFDFNFIDKFLQCAGFKFAEIIHYGYWEKQSAPATQPPPTCAGLWPHGIPQPVVGATSSDISTYINTRVGYGCSPPDPLNFPFTYNMEYVFKYYEYKNKGNYAANIYDTTNVSGNEKSYCFFADNVGPPCSPKPCTKNYQTWSSAMRDVFYNLIKYGNEVTAGVTLPSGPPASCTDNVTLNYLPHPVTGLMTCTTVDFKDTLHLRMKKRCNVFAESRRGEIKALVLDLLKENCWDIDGCATSANSISMTEIDNLVSAIINDLKVNKCDKIGPPTCYSAMCKTLNGGTAPVLDFIFDDCDLNLFQEVVAGKYNFNLQNGYSKCNPVPPSGLGCPPPPPSCSNTNNTPSSAGSLLVDVTK